MNKVIDKPFGLGEIVAFKKRDSPSNELFSISRNTGYCNPVTVRITRVLIPTPYSLEVNVRHLRRAEPEELI